MTMSNGGNPTTYGGSSSNGGRSTTATGSGTNGGSARRAADAAAEATRSTARRTREQLSTLVDRSKDEVGGQMDRAVRDAGDALRRISEQLLALRSGRPEEAGPVVEWLDGAWQQVDSLATRINVGGSRALAQDVRSFARRRPGSFLGLTLLAGFAVGRLTRSGMSPADAGRRPTASAALTQSTVTAQRSLSEADTRLDDEIHSDPGQRLTSAHTAGTW